MNNRINPVKWLFASSFFLLPYPAAADLEDVWNCIAAPDLNEALELCSPMAEQGDPTAQLMLGLHYTTVDKVEAAKWFRLAAKQGVAEAQSALAYMHLIGDGMLQNKVEALKWFSLAADQGYANAQYFLGVLHYKGDGVPKNKQQALTWYSLAAEQGLSEAQYQVGNMLVRGDGVTQNQTEAVRWFNLAAQQGHEGAQGVLDSLPDDVKNPKLASAAGESGENDEQLNSLSVQEMYNRGLKYYHSGNAGQNREMAIKWFRHAAERGLTVAQATLGKIYLHGDGVGIDEKEAYIWFSLAASGGDAKSYRIAVALDMSHQDNPALADAKEEIARREMEITKNRETALGAPSAE